MFTREIVRDEWQIFFNNFSTHHHRWLVKLEVFGEEFGAQIEAQKMPLEGICADLRGNGSDSISITMGETPKSHLTHTIKSPVHVRLEKTDSGVDESLQIESKGGVTTLLSFHFASPPIM